MTDPVYGNSLTEFPEINNSATKPFESLYVVKRIDCRKDRYRGNKPAEDKRVYNATGPARARVTSSVDKKTETFVYDCELWLVGDDGWELVFSSKAGDSSNTIPWNNSIKSSKQREENRKRQIELDKEVRERELYEELRKKFE